MNQTHRHTYHLTAGECDASGHIALPLLVERLIEVATEHANILGIGYSKLVTQGLGWVLSRLSVEMTSYPGINDTYTVCTWIEDINRRFSERNMLIQDAGGHTIGYARTVWVGIDFKTRTMGDLSHISDTPIPIANITCPIAKMPRLSAMSEEKKMVDYTFGYSDLDFNRHVNTVRYISLILNRWPLCHYDENMIRRFDIAFSHECYFNDTVTICTEDGEEASNCEMLRGAEKVVSAKLVWHPRAIELNTFKAL